MGSHRETGAPIGTHMSEWRCGEKSVLLRQFQPRDLDWQIRLAREEVKKICELKWETQNNGADDDDAEVTQKFSTVSCLFDQLARLIIRDNPTRRADVTEVAWKSVFCRLLLALRNRFPRFAGHRAHVANNK